MICDFVKRKVDAIGFETAKNEKKFKELSVLIAALCLGSEETKMFVKTFAATSGGIQIFYDFFKNDFFRRCSLRNILSL